MRVGDSGYGDGIRISSGNTIEVATAVSASSFGRSKSVHIDMRVARQIPNPNSNLQLRATYFAGASIDTMRSASSSACS